jgi:hypothetical protein
VTAPRPGGSYGVARVVALAFVILPLFAVPSYFLGQVIADTLDDDPTNGVLALGLMLGVTFPAILSFLLARSWGKFRWFAALALSVGSAAAAVGVLLATFIAVCSATTCVV